MRLRGAEVKISPDFEMSSRCLNPLAAALHPEIRAIHAVETLRIAVAALEYEKMIYLAVHCDRTTCHRIRHGRVPLSVMDANRQLPNQIFDAARS